VARDRDISIVRLKMILPLHSEHFYADGRGPELALLHWGYRAQILKAAEFMLPDAVSPEDLRHVEFLRPQVVMITPEEVIDYRKLSPYLTAHRPASMFDLGKSDWLNSFSPRHLGQCRHFQLLFYDQLLDVIAEGVIFGSGPYKNTEPNHVTVSAPR